MADRKKVKDGVHGTTLVSLKRVDLLAPGYQVETLEEEIGSTGRLRVLRVCPSDEQSTAPRFLGRWDDAPPKPWDDGRTQRLDFDLVDRHDKKVHKRKQPLGHGTKAVENAGGHRRYQVEIGPDKSNIV